MRRLPADGWKWVALVGEPPPGEWTVLLSWTEDGRRATSTFTVAH